MLFSLIVVKFDNINTLCISKSMDIYRKGQKGICKHAVRIDHFPWKFPNLSLFPLEILGELSGLLFF